AEMERLLAPRGQGAGVPGQRGPGSGGAGGRFGLEEDLRL
ncbi:MAG: hypothetical protein AVDCRST_MAG83-3325, partial [uncultured Arthrobacter sp.]